VSSYTFKSHPIPRGGISTGRLFFFGDLCNGTTSLNFVISSYMEWSLTLPDSWSGLVFIIPWINSSNPVCEVSWIVVVYYIYQGSNQDPNFIQPWNALTQIYPGIPQTLNFPDSWSFINNSAVEYIIPVGWLVPSPMWKILKVLSRILSVNVVEIIQNVLLDINYIMIWVIRIRIYRKLRCPMGCIRQFII